MILKTKLLTLLQDIMIAGGQMTQDDYTQITKILAGMDFHELGAGLPEDRNPHPLPSSWAHHAAEAGE